MPDQAALPAAAPHFTDIRGKRLAWWTSGKGSPSVVLETGLGLESAAWQDVQAAIEPHFRVFRYDRAGRGASDPARGPRDANAMIEDLAQLLQSARLPTPWLLVGHSFGGLLMRLFAHRFRAQTCGLVLVEAMHEGQFERFGPAFVEPTPDDSSALQSMRALWREGWRDAHTTPENIDFPASFRAVSAIDTLGDLPMAVIVAASFEHSPFFAAEQREALQRAWERMQEGFLALSSRAELIRAPQSEHFVQRDAPQVIVDAIGRVARAV
ncbi:alpha/beta hydrolase [Paraburkholderia sp. Ac-20340]|uniref:alpha/beta fold hydrolase n=1 Tax=Paraburkholderia sp. Ac-20340 TaxID=2703888 RepID=UPI00197F19F5|nr:alpha/beta hydrolase [Paraburkholderia sp. Ac-20340]MBN3858648.1 alpha/beta hydrolase [Paraburkholderia sp. Ac-20340]